MRHLQVTSVTAPTGTPTAQWLHRESHRRSSWPTVVRPLDRIVVEVADATADDAVGLPQGAATPEAIAARAVLSGTVLSWAPPRELAGAEQLIELCRRRGTDAVRV